MSEDNIEDNIIEALLWSGDITKNEDGTFKLSDGLHDMLCKMIEERPELYAEIFPDRVN